MKRSDYWSSLIAPVVLAALLLSVLFGCKKDEEAKSGVVGQLIVEGGAPDGATAMLFEDPSRTFTDATVWYTTARQGSVGFAYDPRAAFDWRLENSPTKLLRATATVGADGVVNFANQSEGQYFLVVAKDGFGWTAPMAVNLNRPTVDVGQLRLYTETELRGITSGSRTLLADHHYVIPDFDDFRVSREDTLLLEPGAVLRGGDLSTLQVQGSVIAEGLPDKWISFTSNLHNRLRGDDWEGINFQALGGEPGIGRFRYCRFMYSADAIVSDAADCEVDNCYFANIFGVGVDASSSKPVVTRSVFDGVPSAIRSILPDSIRIEHNIIWSARNLGIELRQVDGGSLYCNWFHNCGQADTTSQAVVGVIFLEYSRNLDISYNNFYSSWFALNLQSHVISTVNIHHNRFEVINRVMDVRATPGSRGPTYPTFQYNCMSDVSLTNIFIHSCSPVDSIPMDARYNFWDTTSELAVLAKIHDCRDDAACPCVNFSPISMDCLSEAGICTQ